MRSEELLTIPVRQIRDQATKLHEFLNKYNVIGISIGVVVGGAVTKLITAFVSDIIMPLLGFVDAFGDWRKYTWTIHKMKFGFGNFLGTLLDFLIQALVVYMVVRRFTKPDPLTKVCPACAEKIPEAAIRCKFCTTDL